MEDTVSTSITAMDAVSVSDTANVEYHLCCLNDAGLARKVSRGLYEFVAGHVSTDHITRKSDLQWKR